MFEDLTTYFKNQDRLSETSLKNNCLLSQASLLFAQLLLKAKATLVITLQAEPAVKNVCAEGATSFMLPKGKVTFFGLKKSVDQRGICENIFLKHY